MMMMMMMIMLQMMTKGFQSQYTIHNPKCKILKSQSSFTTHCSSIIHRHSSLISSELIPPFVPHAPPTIIHHTSIQNASIRVLQIFWWFRSDVSTRIIRHRPVWVTNVPVVPPRPNHRYGCRGRFTGCTQEPKKTNFELLLATLGPQNHENWRF